MISLIAANDRAAVVAALGSMSVSAQIGMNFCGNGGQHLPLSTGYNNDRTATAALTSVIRQSASDYPDFRVDLAQRNLRAAFPSQIHNRESISCEEEESRLKSKANSVDEMDEEDSYLSIPGDEKFAAFRQMAINGKMANKVCRVCGDRALGYNFNVVSCESCKAFFRRNALKKKEFRCPFNDNCDVTALSRRFCQKCRLRKCFEVGMKKEWIMSEEQRLQKRKRIEENRQKKRTMTDKGKSVIDDDDEMSTDEQPSAKSIRVDQQQNMTNAGFSPGSNPATPVASALGNDFSPPDSNDPSQGEQKRNLDGQTFLPSTILRSPAAVITKRDTLDNCRVKPKLESSQLSCLDMKHRSASMSDDRDAALLANSQQFMNTLEMKLGLGGMADGCGFSLETSVIKRPGLTSDDSTITIPKAVLINLISQCHQKQRDSYDLDGLESRPPPIVVRAQRLVMEDGMTSDYELYKCICRCTCGAKTTASCIGPKLVDRGVGPEGDEYKEETVACEGNQICQREIPKATIRRANTDIAQPSRSPVIRTRMLADGLTILEELKIRELIIANQVMMEDLNSSELIPGKTVPDSPAAGSSSPDDPIIGRDKPNGEPAGPIDPTDVIHMTDVCVRRIIKMCKRLSAFKSLCQDDQIALLKGGCTELMILRGVMTFIPAKECWRPVGWKNSLLSLDVMKGVKGNVYEEHKKYLHSFRDEWRTCDAIMLCLAAITLFSPERPNIVHVESVQVEQELYIDLLKRYLDIMYGVGTASEEAFQELLGRVKAVGRLNDYAATIFVDVNPRDVEPLLIEIFDLK